MSAQVTPSPEKPLLQVQILLPAVFEQTAFVLQPPLFVAHSSTSAQVLPSPVKPVLQAQVWLPAVLVQVACASQPPLFVWHSSTSAQVIPSPVNPALHAQAKPVAVEVQAAFTSQGLGVTAPASARPTRRAAGARDGPGARSMSSLIGRGPRAA